MVPSAIGQLAAVAAVGVIGTTALAAAQVGATGVVPAAVSAAPAVSSARPYVDSRAVPKALSTQTQTQAHVAATAMGKRPSVARSVVHHAAPAQAVRWIPSGTGMWIYEWNKTAGGNAAAVVAQARAAGLSHIFVRTGSSHDHYTGGPLLHALLPATAHTNLHVVAWDFPTLKNPYKDAWRLAYAAWADYHSGVPHVAAVAPDIETPAEGTHTSAKRVSAYLSALRRLLPKNVAILTTVPWPSSARVGIYPYKAVAEHSDAILPMTYWYDNSPRQVTAESFAFLRRYHRPIQPVGQGYDGKLDVPSLPHNNLRKQMPMFFVTARENGASAVSLWSWQAAPPIAWAYISYANHNHWFPAKR